MRLATYRSCTWREKRDMLQSYWSGRPAPSPQIAAAAREYSPYALAMVVVIALECALVTLVLGWRGSTWTVAGALATLFMTWVVAITWRRDRQVRTAS